MSATLFYQLLICASIIGFNLFALESYDLISFESLASFYVVATYATLTYLYCYLSDTLTTNFYNVGDTFFGCWWYAMPVRHQKLFILPIQRSQRRFHLNGLGLVDCSLKNFLSVNLKCFEIITSSLQILLGWFHSTHFRLFERLFHTIWSFVTSDDIYSFCGWKLVLSTRKFFIWIK